MLNFPKNIILISLDCLRFDCVGYQKDKRFLEKYNVLKYLDTSLIDQFSEKGTSFSSCISTAPYTTASHASILTGLYPPAHHVRAFCTNRLNNRVKTLSQILKKAGYKTFHHVDASETFELVDLNRGADFISSTNDQYLFSNLKKFQKEKKFIFVHFFDIHVPYLYSPCKHIKDYNKDFFQRRQELISKYKIDIKTKDRSIGGIDVFIRKKLRKKDKCIDECLPDYIKGITKFCHGRFNFFLDQIKKLGLFEDLLLIITSDHGETVVNDNWLEHDRNLSDGVIRVPLVIYSPGVIPENKIVENQISNIDIMPTILELTGVLEKEYQCQGKSLVSLIFKRNREKDSLAYSETWQTKDLHKKIHISQLYKEYKKQKNSHFRPNLEDLLIQRSLRTPHYKYILQGDDEVSSEGALFKKTNIDFIQSLFRKYFFRFADDKEIVKLRKKLEKKEISRKALISQFARQANQPKFKRKIIYNLKMDPFEENPLLFQDCFEIEKEYSWAYQTIKQISDSDYNQEREEVSFSTEKERDTMIKRLKNLGYLD